MNAEDDASLFWNDELYEVVDGNSSGLLKEPRVKALQVVGGYAFNLMVAAGCT